MLSVNSAPSGNGQAQDQPAPGMPLVVCPAGQCFEDVPPSNPFYTFTNMIYTENLVTGYACGGPEEPCVPPNNRPYYRPTADVSRGQMSKFIYNARHMPGIYIESNAFFPVLSITDSPTGAGIWGTGRVGGSSGLNGLGAGIGPIRDFYHLSSGISARGTGSSNSVGAVLMGVYDNGAWIGSEDAAHHMGLYVVHQRGGLDVGNTGDDPLNDSYIGGDLGVGGNCTGCVMVMPTQNTGTSDLHLGEVASMVSAPTGPAMIGNKPIAGVARSQGSYSTSVIGVVTYRWNPPDSSAPEGTRMRTGYYDRDATTIKPGEYMGVVTSGAHERIKVSAAGGPIHVGDLLVASDTAGVAMKADAKQITFGSVIGKAMGNLETGDGTIPIMVTLK
jgi:hypothetical protein